MFKHFKTAIFYFGVMLIVHGTSSAFAAGITNSSIGARGFAMAGTPVSNVKDATAVYYNPAGLTLIEPDTWSAEVYGYMTLVKFKYEEDGTDNDSDGSFFVPGNFLSHTKENWAWGVGMYIPFAGGGMVFEDFMGVSGEDYDMSAGYMAITTAGAYKINPKWSIGAGFTLYGGQMIANTPQSDIEVKKTPAGYGGNVGVMYAPTGASRIGLNFRTSVSMEMEGDITAPVVGEGDVTMEFMLPWVLDVGYTHYLTDALMLSVRYSYYAYGMLDSYANTYEFATAAYESEEDTDYKNSWTLGVGGEYILNSKYTIRFGSSYATHAREKSGIKNQFDIDPTVLTLNTGLGYNLNKLVDLNIAYSAGFGFERENSYTDNGQNKEVKFDQDNHIFLFGAQFKF